MDTELRIQAQISLYWSDGQYSSSSDIWDLSLTLLGSCLFQNFTVLFYLDRYRLDISTSQM